MTPLEALSLLLEDVTLPEPDEIPASIEIALAVREHLLRHVRAEQVLVGLAERATTDAAAPEREVVVAYEATPDAEVRLVVYCGPVRRDWWARYATLVPLTWERLPAAERRRRTDEVLSLAYRAELDEQVQVAMREAADDPRCN